MSSEIKRYAIVGLGIRSAFYYQGIINDFKDNAELVGLCDTNQTRMNAANDRIEEIGGTRKPTYKSEQFDQMVAETKPDVIIVTTIDLYHHVYCIRAMELGCDAITEKPMTIDEEKLQAMIDAERRTGKQVRVLFNYRYAPHHTKVRELIASGVIGDVATVHMDWILDCAHGSDFMRRWHRTKDTSGGIQMHKSIHHFDLVHFWLATEPVLVFCLGDLRFYGKENAQKRGVKNTAERYLDDPEASKNDPFAFQLGENAQLKKLYLEAEHEDGYIRDRNCFAEGITIEDNLSMVIKYANRAVMTYNTYAYAPWEGYRCVFNGDKGRLEINVVESHYHPGGEPISEELSEVQKGYIQGGVEQTKIVVYPLFGEPYVVDVQKQDGGHGGGDPVMLKDVLIGREQDKYNRAASIRDGGNAVLVGVGANKSMESGMPIMVQDLVEW